MIGYFDLPDVGRFILDDELDWSAEQVQDQEKADVTLETLELVGSHEVGDTHMRPGIPSLVRGAEFYHVQPVVLDPPPEKEAGDWGDPRIVAVRY